MSRLCLNLRNILFLFSILGLALSQSPQPPYSIPTFVTLGSSSWPSASAWASLNSTVGGRVQAIRPWAAVCYTNDPLHDAEKCQMVISTYANDTAREIFPSALLWTNWETCGYGVGCALNYTNPQPVRGMPCHQGSTPPYSIAIYNATDASNIIKWATTNNLKVKLTIKNTGHDYMGRSAAPSTLQVNTHLMNGIAYERSFVPQGSLVSPVPAFTIGAGTQLYRIYDFAAENNFSAVLGGCLTVGAAGGYVQGGGHGSLTPAYGLSADNALEFELVTADGQIRVVNEAQNSDLFWALRGGGAGSWGIVTSATFRVYPAVSVGASTLTIVPNATQDISVLGVQFLALAGKYQNQWLSSGMTTGIIMTTNKYSLSLYWPTTSTTLTTLFPFFDELKSLSWNYTVISNVTEPEMFPTVSASVIQSIGPFFDSLSLYGASSQSSSRLIPQSYLDPHSPAKIQAVTTAIWEGFRIVNQPLATGAPGTLGTIPLMILSDMPAATRQLVNTTGANPALYDATWHVVYTAPWTIGTSYQTNAAIMNAVRNAVNPLNTLGITSSYQNEGNAFEENWQEAFFGYKYERLSQIKRKYDPYNFFTSYKGVDYVPTLPAYECYAREQKEMLSVPGMSGRF